MGFYADPNEVLRAAIRNFGESVIAGKAPNGRTETLRQLFERTVGAFEAVTPKRAPGQHKGKHPWRGKAR